MWASVAYIDGEITIYMMDVLSIVGEIADGRSDRFVWSDVT